MFRHVVLFRWIDDVSDDQIRAVSDTLAGLPAALPEIRAYHFGPDAGVNENHHQFVVVADFDSVNDYLVYRDHPVHRAIIDEHIAPVLAERAAVQYELA
jgi:hypothetical protein